MYSAPLRTCNDVLDGAVLALVDMAAVLALPLSQLSYQLLLLPLAFMRWRLVCGKEKKEVCCINKQVFVYTVMN